MITQRPKKEEVAFEASWSDDSLFDEWRDLFNKYRSAGYLDKETRFRFRLISAELRSRGFFKRSPSI